MEERKQRHARISVSRRGFKFVASDVDKFISGRLTLGIVHQSGN